MNRFILFIPFHNPWHWHTDYANQTALLMSRHHPVFCFLWGDAVSLREIMLDKKPYRPVQKRGGLQLYQPLYLFPGKRIEAVKHINLFINLIAAYILCSLTAINQKRILLFWCFGIYDPVFLLLPRFFRFTKSVYDCVDTPSHPDPAMTVRLEAAEAALLKNARLVTANSRVIRARLRQKRDDVQLVPMGFRDDMFRRPVKHTLPFSQRKPIIGFVGAIDYRLDFPLLTKLVTRNTQWNFALIGPVFYDHMNPKTVGLMESLLKKSNVYHTKVPMRNIPDILRQFDAAIIPYRSSLAFNRYSFPMKTMEYLYAGKQVISSNVIELKQYYPIILTALTPAQWQKSIRQALEYPLAPALRRKARAIAKTHTWEKKTNALIRFLKAI